MNKNDEIQIRIEDISHAGEGIGHVDGMAFFVKDAIPGDLVLAGITKLKKTYGYARVVRILEPSKDRRAAKCPVAGRCGGCQIMCMDYPAQLRFKQNLVREKLMRIGGFEEAYLNKIMQPILGQENENGGYEPFYFRNKAQYPVQRDKDGKVRLGFYAAHSHRIVESESCCIGPAVFDEICSIIRSHPAVDPYDEETGRGLLRHVLLRRGHHTGEVMVCFVVNAEGPNKRVLDMLAGLQEALQPYLSRNLVSICVNYNAERGNVILGQRTDTLSGSPYITDKIADIYFHISAPSFYQVNSVQAERLYAKALEYAALTGTETVWDIYCGIGTISLFLARKAKMVYGVEAVPEAVENARENARLNHIANAEFFLGKAEEVLPAFYNGKIKLNHPDAEPALHPDVIVVDPPRKGCDVKCLDTILKMQPRRIVYVSCDPATLARDLKILCEDKYQLEGVAAVDQFCHSVHIETVCLLGNKKRKPDDVLRVTVDVDRMHEILEKEKAEKEIKEAKKSE